MGAVIEVTPAQVAALAAAIDFHLPHGWSDELGRNVIAVAPERIAAMLEKQAELRDRFAAAALQGLLAAGEHHGRRDERGVIVSVADAHSLTRDAYALADEMMAARKEKP